MKDAFPGRFQLIDDMALPAKARPSAVEYAVWVKEKLASLLPGDDAILRFRRPPPTAAFSPQDTTHPDYERIKEQTRAHGFEPIERGTGGRLTIFDEHALAVTLIWPHPEPHAHTIRRYDIFSGIIADALKSLGIDARVGELPNEYCPGKFSINAGGQVKLVGIAQRMNRRCVQMGAIIAVERSEKACSAIGKAYQSMGLSFDPETYGAVTELVTGLTYDKARSEIRHAVAAAFAF